MSMSLRQRSTTRKLATARQPVEIVDIIWGVVTIINAGLTETVTLQLLSSSTTVNARYNGSYEPTVGDDVMCTYKNKDLFCIGAPAPQGVPSGGGGEIGPRLPRAWFD